MILHGETCALFESAMMDPDFDDDWFDRSFLRHSIDADGVVQLHPDGINNDCEAVPIVSHDAVGRNEYEARCIERDKRQAKAERARQKQLVEARQRRLELARAECLEWGLTEDLYLNMEVSKPLEVGKARVWGRLAMIREEGLPDWKSDPKRAVCPEFWRGHSLIIFNVSTLRATAL